MRWTDAMCVPVTAHCAQPQFHRYSCMAAAGSHGSWQLSFRPMHSLFFSLFIRLHIRRAALGKQRWLPGQMHLVHGGDVAEWEHDGREAALHRWWVGTGVFLPLHHFRRYHLSNLLRRPSVADFFLSLQRPRRVSINWIINETLFEPATERFIYLVFVLALMYRLVLVDYDKCIRDPEKTAGVAK